MDRTDVALIERSTPFRGYFRIDRYRVRHRLYEGGWSEEIVREVFERGHAVGVVPYDPEADRLVFIEQFRIGAFAALGSPWFADNFSPWMIEFVAGIIEPGEDPAAVARREAREEADCAVTEMIPIYHYMASPGGTTESVFLFCGRVRAPADGAIHGLTAEHENIRVRVVSPKIAFAWLDEGRIRNAMTLIGLQWFRLNHAAVRARWTAPSAT